MKKCNVCGQSIKLNKAIGKRVCFDFGHGGSDPGAIGIMGVKEKDLVYEIGMMVCARLQGKGVDVVFTRTKDEYVTLKGRCDISNNSNSDLFISLHCNAFSESTAKGVEVFHHPSSKYGRSFAEILLKGIVDAGLYTRNRGVKTSRDFYVLKGTRATALLVEIGFITNYDDLEIIQSNKYAFATVMTDSIINCLQKL